MSITHISQYAPRATHHVALAVTQEGADSAVVRVASGAFTCGAEAYQLIDDCLFTLTSDPIKQTDVFAYLCWNKALSKAELVVDEVIAGDALYELNSDPDRMGLHLLYSCTIPPATTDFSGVAIRHFSIVERPA